MLTKIVWPTPIWDWSDSTTPSPNTNASSNSIRIIHWCTITSLKLTNAEGNRIEPAPSMNSFYKSGKMPMVTFPRSSEPEKHFQAE